MFRVRTLVFQRRRSAEEREGLAILKELIAAESGELEKKQTKATITVIIVEVGSLRPEAICGVLGSDSASSNFRPYRGKQ